MPSEELLCRLAGIMPNNLSKEESIIIEAELFTRLYEKLKEFYKEKQKDYFKLLKFDKEMEMLMFEKNFTRCVINDILSTNEYTLSGIAYYTETPEEIVFEIASGHNTNPSVDFFRKIVEIHRTVRSDLYRALMEKILFEYSENS
jgi:hypothetical protein